MPGLSTIFRAAAGAFVVLGLLATAGNAEPAAPVDEVRDSLDALNQWLDTSPNGPGWREYLRTEKLEAQLADPKKADPQVVAEILDLYVLAAPETDRPRYLRVRKALKAWIAEMPSPPAEELPEMVRKAKDQFVPLTEAAPAAAKAELAAALERLDGWLKPSDPQSARWREFLRWDDLQKQLAREEGPDLAELDAIYANYSAGYDGLDLSWFKDVRVAFRKYLVVSRALADDSLRQQYEQLLDALPKYLEAYRKKPTVEGAAALRSVIQWLDETSQAPQLVAAIRHQYTRPNLFARIDADVVASGMEGPVDETEPVTDSILGASVRGTGHNVGVISVELVPSQTRAEVHTIYRGTVTSSTSSYKGPARVSSSGTTKIETTKPILLSAEGFSTLPATSHAETKSTITGISTSRGGVAQRAASSQAYEQKYQAEQISARHAESRANRRADAQAAKMLADPQQSFLTKFREPLVQRELFPQQFDFTTTKDAVHLTALEVGPYDLGAPSAPPAAVANPHLALSVHESMVNNMAEEAFSGMIFTEEQFLETLKQLLGEVPERFKSDEEHEPWTITFASTQPVVVSFGEGEFRITIHGRRYASGDASYPGMDVTAVYKIAQGDKGPKAVRQGELEIFPPGFKPDSGDRLSVRQQTIRRMLERRFGKIFEEEIVPDPLELPGRWAETGKYGLTQWVTAAGWMVMAWNRVPGSEKTAAGSTATEKSEPAGDAQAEPKGGSN